MPGKRRVRPMTVTHRRHRRRLAAAALTASACTVAALASNAAGDDVSQLQTKLGSAQSQLGSTKQQEQSLSGKISALNGEVSTLSGQISLVQAREDAARERLETYEDRLAAAKAAVTAERKHLAHLRVVLHRALKALSAELVSEYEQPQETLVSLVLNATGFQDLVDNIEDMSDAKKQSQTIITVTRTARARAQAAAARLTALERTDATESSYAATQTNGLAGMNALLQSREAALADERAAQSAALNAAQAKGSQLQAAIATIQQHEAAAKRAAQTVKYTATTPASSADPVSSGSTGSTPSSSGSGGGSLSGSDGWAIPYPIVLCESGGQNLPPNSAGASGYYQIMPATWKGFGGTGPAAYLASKSEQDAVAARIWRGGAGASDWTCSAITGIS